MATWLEKAWEQTEAIAGVAAAFFIGYFPPVVFVFFSLVTLGQRRWAWGLLPLAGLVVTVVMAVWGTRLVGGALYDRYPQYRPVRPPKVSACTERGVPGSTGCACGTRDEGRLPKLVAAFDEHDLSLGDTLDEIAGSPARPVALLVADRLCNVPLILRPMVSLWWLGHFLAGAFIGFGASRAVIALLRNPAVAFMVVLPLAFQVAFLFAVNLYLVMAVAVICHDRRLHEVIWRCRFVIDLLLSAGIMFWRL